MEEKVILQDLPTSVRGYCFHDDDGEAFVVLNSRLTREQNRKTYEHEKQHLARGDMFNEEYNEYKGGIP